MRYLTLIIGIMVSMTGVLQARNIHINARGNGEYPTIQAAIDASVDGDVILLADGTYRGDLNRDINFNNKAVTVQSENGPGRCIIDCEGSNTDEHRAFYFNHGEGAGTVLDGVTIRNGYRYGPGYSSGAFGGAILCINNSSPAINNCIFEDNFAAAGGALYMTGSNSVISNCVFRNNSAETGIVDFNFGNSPQMIDCFIHDNNVTYACGAVRAYQANPSLTNCHIADNQSDNYAGGLLFEDGSDVSLTDCIIERNVAGDSDGGGICCSQSTMTLQRCFISDNSANSGGGASIADSTVTFEACIIDDNTSDSHGGGVYFRAGGSIDLRRCFIRGNISGSRGGAISATTSAAVTLTNCLIAGNASNAGGALYGDAVTFVLSQDTLAENYARNGGGAVYLINTAVITLDGSILWNNRMYVASNLGPQIYAENNSQATVTLCDVSGGQGGTYAEPGSVITWNDSNIDDDPCFVGEGAWNDNNTPGVITDDIWSSGDYQLMPGSPCIDARIWLTPVPPNEYDVVGNYRHVGIGDDRGAYESQFATTLQCTKVTLKADKTRSDDAIADSFTLGGNFTDNLGLFVPPSMNDFENADYCTLRVGAWSQTIATDEFQIRNDKCTYRGRAPGLTSLVLDFNRGTFKATAKNIDLTGSDTPISVVIGLGSYYAYQSLIDDGGVNDIINGRKQIPIQFMVGDADTLRITKAACTNDGAGHITGLSIQGEIALAAPINLTAVETILHWGTVSFAVPMGDFELIRENLYRFIDRDETTSFTANATIDLNKCTFKINLKNTDALWQTSPLDLRLQLGPDFDQTVTGVTFR